MGKRIFGILLLAAGVAHAGVTESSNKSREKSNHETSTSQLRCWQYGTLIFEETNLTAKQLPAGDKEVIFARKGGQDKIHLFNLDGAACMYRENE